MKATDSHDHMLSRVRELVRAIRNEEQVGGRLHDDMHLIQDIGLDSMNFVDLTVSIERALGIDEFPMQDWLDQTLEAGEPPTLRALARACQALQQRVNETGARREA